MKNIVVLISGRGSNLKSILKASQEQRWPARIAAVISNNPQAQGLIWAQEQGIETQALDHKAFATREAFDQALIPVIDAYQPDLVVLAGFMRILTPAFVAHYENRMINIHPSLLPHFPGLNTHQRALDAGHAHAGATVHWVTAELDHGPTLGQAKVPVLAGDTEDSLADRVLQAEHVLYPNVIRQLFESGLL